MSGIKPEDLAPDVRALLGKPSAEGACPSDQPVCNADPRVTSQLTNDPPPTNQVRPWRIKNASKGDLIMSPGGPSGLIGGLLSKLDPPQYFSHMAIMTQDQIELRHATANDKRVSLFYNGSILGVVKAPTDGIEEDALRFGWPGTITQSFEKAYLTWRDHPIQRQPDGTAIKDDDNMEIPVPGWGEHDRSTGKDFLIDAMSFGPVPIDIRGEPGQLWPLVVSPCQGLETKEVRRALHRVADAALELRGHYRFYAYTRADIGLDGSKTGPQMFEATAPDSNCTGSGGPLLDVLGTIPMVCSTFIWLAVQRANETAAASGQPRIVLDGRPRRSPRADEQERTCEGECFFPRLTQVDKIDAQTPDGLYFYGEGERLSAGNWLHDDYMVPKVRGEVDDALPLISRAEGVAILVSVGELIVLLGSLPLGTIVALLGIPEVLLNNLIVWTTDMPDDVANQLCNAFANDHCETAAKDSDDWRMPGLGYSVSPDNIVNSWAPPTSQDGEIIHGLYGSNDRIKLSPPAWDANPPPPSTWQISQGKGGVEGRVFFRDDSGDRIGVRGAKIRIGCSPFVSLEDGLILEQGLPSGRYWAVASFTQPVTGLVMASKGQIVEVPVDSVTGLHIELIPPLETRREVIVSGKMDLVNRYAFGKDWWDHPRFTMNPAYLGLDYFPPDVPEFVDARARSMKQTPQPISEKIDEWGVAELECDLEIQNDRSIKVTYRARLKDDDDDPWQETGEILVRPKQHPSDPGVTHELDLARDEMAWPVRAHIEFTIHNDRAL